MMKRVLLTLLLGLSAATVRADITSNLVLHWKLDEGTGTSAADSSGIGNTGTLNGGATWQTGHIGPYSVRTDGTDDYISGAVTALNSAPNATIACWINRTSAGTKQTFGSEVASNYFNVIWFTDNKLYLRRNSGGVESSAANTGTGWFHIVVTYDGAGTPKDKLYVNGVDTAITGTPVSNTTLGATAGNAFYAGRSLVNGFCTGDYDEVRVYSRTLSQSDVTELYGYTGASTGSVKKVLLQSHLRPQPKYLIRNQELCVSISR